MYSEDKQTNIHQLVNSSRLYSKLAGSNYQVSITVTPTRLMTNCVCDLYLIQITVVYPTDIFAEFTVVDIIKHVAFFGLHAHR